MKLDSRRRLIVALDFETLPPALELARSLAGWAGMFKIGKQLFTASGPEAVREIAGCGSGIFLDLKFHDIPNTVAGAITSARNLPGVLFMTLHTLGGPEMMRAAAAALAKFGGVPNSRQQRLLGVTILTSMDAQAMRAVGISGRPRDRVVRLAKLAKQNGLDGVVASAEEAKAVRKACGKEFLIVVAGVRPASWSFRKNGQLVAKEQYKARAKDDQRRIATPMEAVQAGADYVVVGRPITEAADPRAAAQAIVAEIEGAEG